MRDCLAVPRAAGRAREPPTGCNSYDDPTYDPDAYDKEICRAAAPAAAGRMDPRRGSRGRPAAARAGERPDAPLRRRARRRKPERDDADNVERRRGAVRQAVLVP